MTSATFRLCIVRCVALLLALSPCHLVSLASARAEAPSSDDERTLRNAGLPSDGPALLAFFHARARIAIDGDRLRELLRRFADGSERERREATTALLGLGPLALPSLRQTANDPDHPAAERALRCLPWLEGPSSSRLLIAAAHKLAQRRPKGTAAALLAYLPFTVDGDVIAAVEDAVLAVATLDGQFDPALLRGLHDPSAVRRAAAGVALCRSRGTDAPPLAVRKLLNDPAAKVRLRIALALTEANDAEAVPVLIDLLAELDAEQRAAVEDFLTQLAGEGTPLVRSSSGDKIAGKIHRDAWASWWRHIDDPVLLAGVRKRTPSADERRNTHKQITKLADEKFVVREKASKALFALGRRVLPQLRAALHDQDAETARRARLLIERIERQPADRLPEAAVRLLALRQPAGAVEALLDYLPSAEQEHLAEEVQKALAALARREDKAKRTLRCVLDDSRQPPVVRMRVALALASAGRRQAVAALIDLLAMLPDEQANRAEEALYRLAGDSVPKPPDGAEPATREKRRAAWADWWKANAKRVDLRPAPARRLLGYTLICDENRVLEVDRQGKTRWSIDNLDLPTDAWILPGHRVLITEWNAHRVTERDWKGNVLWKKDGLPDYPVYAQRLPNGNTFIAIKSGTILEVDRAGKEIYKIDKIPDLVYAYRSRRGAIVCLTQKDQCVTVDTTGKRLRHFAVKYPSAQRGGLDLLPDGRILIASEQAGKVMEYDNRGKLLKEWSVPRATTATGLANGHLLVSSPDGKRVVELDRAGKIVWEKTNVAAYRARRR